MYGETRQRFTLTPEQATAIQGGLGAADGPCTLVVTEEVGDTGDWRQAQTARTARHLLIDPTSDTPEALTAEGHRLMLFVGTKTAHVGDLAAIDALGIPWSLVVEAPRGGSARGSRRVAFKDFAALEGLAHLAEFELPVSGLTTLENLPLPGSLKRLSLYGAKQLSSLAGLERWTALESLTLGLSPIKDATCIAGLTSLTSLTLAGVPLSEEILRPLCALRALSLRNSPGLATVDFLREMPDLERLTLVAGAVRRRSRRGRASEPEAEGDVQLADVSGLSHATALQYLELGRIQLTDLEVIRGLDTLHDLSLSYLESLTHLDALTALPGLRQLSVRNCGAVQDPQPISQLTNLESLTLVGRGWTEMVEGALLAPLTSLCHVDILGLGDLSVVQEMSGLTHLSIANPVSVASLDALASLSSLETLKLTLEAPAPAPVASGEAEPARPRRRARVSRAQSEVPLLTPSLEVFSGLRALRKLSLVGIAGLLDLRPLSGLEALESLEIKRVARVRARTVQDSIQAPTGPALSLAPLGALRRLTHLNLSSQSHLASLDGLDGATALEVLDISATPVRELGALAGHPALTSLRARYSHVEALSALAEIATLTDIEISDAPVLRSIEGLPPGLLSLAMKRCLSVETLAPLATLSRVRRVWIGGTLADGDLCSLESLTELRSLDLSETLSDESALRCLPDLRRCTALESLYASNCSNLQDITGIEGLPSLTELNLDECPSLRPAEAQVTLLTLPALRHLSIAMPPEVHARVLARAASQSGDANRLFEAKVTEPAPKIALWMEACRQQPTEPGLLGDVGTALRLLTDDPRAGDEVPELIHLATTHEAPECHGLFQTAVTQGGLPRVAEALRTACAQATHPLPPDALVSLADALADAAGEWVAPMAAGLRDQTLLALTRQLTCEDPPAWGKRTAERLRACLDGRHDPALPNGYPVTTDVHDAVITALEASPLGPISSCLFGSVASDHVRSDDASWMAAAHRRLSDIAFSQEDVGCRDQALSEIAAGLGVARDPTWACERLDALLARAAEIDADTSVFQTAVARAHAVAERWDAAANAAFAVARPLLRDDALEDLAVRVLETTLVDRARRALSLRQGISAPSMRRDRLVALGMHEALGSDWVAYGQLMAVLAEYPEAQQRVAAHVVAQTPDLLAAAPVDGAGAVTDREAHLVAAALAERDRAWQEALGVEVPPTLRAP